MRVLGVDFGLRRLGLALSDATGLLARPWRAVPAGPSPGVSAGIVAQALTAGGEEAAEVGEIVVGLPRRLHGEDTHTTEAARAFAHELAARTGLPVHLQDERLTSVEVEAHLASRERDWRVRKRQLDAAAASVILQDYLDARRGPAPDDDGFVS